MKDISKKDFLQAGFTFTRSSSTWKTVGSHGRNGCIIGTNGDIFGVNTISIISAINNLTPTQSLALSANLGKHGLNDVDFSEDLTAHPLLAILYTELTRKYHEIRPSAHAVVATGYHNLQRDFPEGLDAPVLAVSFNRASIHVGTQDLRVPNGDIAYIKKGVPFSCRGKGHSIFVTAPDIL